VNLRPTPDVLASDGPPTRPVPAATVVLIRPGETGVEVLLTRRPPTMAFGADIHVFPGGRLDPADSDPATLARAGLSEQEAAANLGLGLAPDGPMAPASALAHHIAAVRETREETGIEIAAPDLIALTRWVTPPSLVRRFDVRFFAAFVAPGTEVGATSDEVVDSTWVSPRAGLEAAARGELVVWQPTFVTLQQLEGLSDLADVRAAFAVGTVRGGPAIERPRQGLARVDAAWAAGIPGRRAIGWLLGRDEVVAVNPADPTGVTSDAIVAEVAAAGGRLAGVVVTGLPPERHAGVEMLAHGLGLPVAAPAGTFDWAPYPVIDLEVGGSLPFGDPGLSVGDVLALG
jgi:8-oxo-dGTP pyrophosphatase MutT (NUDIX family)